MGERMPGINANLSNAAFAIWEEVPKKGRKTPLGAAGDEGRSVWLSRVIIDHHQQMQWFKTEVNELTKEKIELMEKLQIMTDCRDALQAHVLGTDGPKS